MGKVNVEFTGVGDGEGEGEGEGDTEGELHTKL